MKRECVLSVVLIAASCASPPPTQEMAASEYGRESARIEAVEKFEELKEACARAGGTVYVRRTSSGKFPPTVMELRAATCARRQPSGPF